MSHVGVFPFGQPVVTLRQSGRGPRRVFVLGVYASAVHARWVGADRKTRVKALAVASEPEIFWTGQGAEDLIREVAVPEGAGSLEPAGCHYNGPSGRALDDCYLAPLGISRAEAWLCDLVPHSCMNGRQAHAIDRAYRRCMNEYDLPEVRWRRAPKLASDWHDLVDEKRRDEIASEVAEASPEILITLGDEPLRRFARYFGTKSRVARYGESDDGYGRLHEVTIAGWRTQLLPLVHPRQAARLGRSSPKWAELHKGWITGYASGQFGKATRSDAIRPTGAE